MPRVLIACLFLALGTLLVYSPVRQHELLNYDDPEYVSANVMVQDGLTWAGVKWAFTTFHSSNWHPLTWLSHMLDRELFGFDPGAYHLVNVLLHAINSVLLFLLLLRLTGRFWPGALVAALFAWHPLRVESVAWVAERKDVLSAFFFMLTLLAYARHAHSPQSTVHSPHSTASHASRFTFHVSRWYWLCLILFAIGLMCKPMLVTLPFVLLLLDYWPLRRVSGDRGQVPGSRGQGSGGEEAKLESRNSTTHHGDDGSSPNRQSTIGNRQFPLLALVIKEKLPFLLLAAASCAVTFIAQQRGAAMVALEIHPLPFRLANAVVAYGNYLLHTFYPVNLAAIYPLPREIAPAALLLAASVLLALSWLVWRARRRQPYLLTGWLWYLGMLVPVIGLVQVGLQAMADRYTCLPQIGVFIGVVFGLTDLSARLRLPFQVLALGASLVLAASLYATATQLKFWRDSETLFTRTVAVTGPNPLAQNNLGVALGKRGQPEPAIEHLEEALRVQPDYALAHNNLALLLSQAGRSEDAIRHLQETRRLQPSYPEIDYNLGMSLFRAGRLDEAMPHLRSALEKNPADLEARKYLVSALLRIGRTGDAVGQLRELTERDPGNVAACNTLAGLLATASDDSIRDGARALELARRAERLSGGKDPAVIASVAAALAETGQFPEALAAAQRALDLATAQNQTALVKQLRTHIQRYETSTPLREPGVTNAPPR